MEAPSSWKIVKQLFLRKPDAGPKKEIRSYRAIAPTSVMSKWYAACVILRLEKEKEPQKLEAVARGWDGSSCQLQGMMTQPLQKQWEWKDDRMPMMRHRQREENILFCESIRKGSVEAPLLWLKMAMQISEKVEPEWKSKKECRAEKDGCT